MKFLSLPHHDQTRRVFGLRPAALLGRRLHHRQAAVEHFPPLFMMTLIYAGIAVVLMFTARDKIKTSWRSLFVISACSVTVQGALIFWALQNLPASVATLLVQTQVPFTVLLSWPISGERPTPRKLIGTAIALAGVGAVIGLPDDIPPLMPVAAVILGSLIWALGQVLTAKFGRDDGILQLKGYAIAGLPQLVIATLLLEEGQWRAVGSATSLDWLTLTFVGAVGFLVAYTVWFALLRRCRVEDVAPFTLLMPVIGLVTAVLVLGETIALVQIFGGLVILAGLAVVAGNNAFAKRLKAAEKSARP